MLRHELLRALEAELRPWLPTDEIAARLAEADAHIADGIAGWLELGLDPEAAEREAVAAFGAARHVGHAIVQPNHARSLAVRLRWLGGVYAALLLPFFLASWLLGLWIYTAMLPLLALAGGAVGLAAISFRARHAAPIPLAATGLAASLVLWITMGATTLNLWNYGGMGFVTRWEAGRLAQRGRDRLAGGATGANAYVPAEILIHDAEAISRAQEDPLGNFVSQGGQALGIGMGVAGGAVLIDLVAAGLGAAWASRRRRRPTVA